MDALVVSSLADGFLETWIDAVWNVIKEFWAVWLFLAIFTLPVCICLGVTRFCGRWDLARYMGFVALHLGDYATNVLVMVIFWKLRPKYLSLLLPAHCIVGFFCMYTAFTCVDMGNLHPLPKFFMIVIVLGLMQGVQVKLAHDDYIMQRSLHEQEPAEGDLSGPPMMPARFQCKAMDGLLEGTLFSFVCMYSLLKVQWVEDSVPALPTWTQITLYISSFLSFLTTGLALMEVDFRTSASMQRVMNRSMLGRMRHYLFRVSEVVLRLLTVLVFLTFMRTSPIWWVAFVVVGVDYLFGVALLLSYGWNDPMKHSTFLLGVPFFLANVMQFVDAPGMSKQAKRITRIIVPFRALQLLALVVSCLIWGEAIKVPLQDADGRRHDVDMWEFTLGQHPAWSVAWIGSGVSYYILLLTYACWVRPTVDLHAAVSYGQPEHLKVLLPSLSQQESSSSVDINRYGPDGRTPLHLAALLGHVECLELLLEARANIRARTNDRLKSTALHLAALQNGSHWALRCLCEAASGDPAILNAANGNGDTALHVAARRHNIIAVRVLLLNDATDTSIRNLAGKRASECAISEQFAYDRNNHAECDIARMFQSKEAGESLSWPSSQIVELRGRSTTSNDAGSFSGLQSHLSSTSATGLDAGPSSPGRQARPSTPSPSSPSQIDLEAAGIERERSAGRLSARSEGQHVVPLLGITPAAEAAFARKSAEALGKGRSDAASSSSSAPPPMSNVGLSSFMLSAGLGALSRALLSSIQEDSESIIGNMDLPHVSVKFEDFEEVRKLGGGTFGKVMLVKHRESGKDYAMKIVEKNKFKTERMAPMMHTEQHILKTTRHPCIVSLHYAFQGSNFWALVMDFCSNGDLQDHLAKTGQPGLSLMECARLGGEALLGLEHLHNIQVIFRDMKLENVVLDAHMHCKVTDFGLAKLLHGSASAVTQCGSYGYVAPEILIGKGQAYTYAVDLYSYGVVLYMLLSGGEPSPNKPEQRLPPMRHGSLRRKLQAAVKSPPADWAEPRHCALELILALTADKPEPRGTATTVKNHAFFTQLIGENGVDRLLEEIRMQRASSMP